MMTNLILLTGLISAIVVSLVKVKEWKSNWIIALQAIGVVMLLVGNPSLGFYLFGGISILAMIYFIVKSSGLKRWQTVLFFIPLILVFLFNGLNLPGANIIRLSMVCPIIIFGLVSLKPNKPYKSISNMVVFMAFAVIELLELILSDKV